MHHLSALDLSVDKLIAAAAAGGANHVCLFTQQPADSGMVPVVIDDARIQQVRQQLDDAGLSVLGITSFPILRGVDPADYGPGLDRGAALGAICANARIGDLPLESAADKFARFGGLCAARGILPCIEFTGFGKVDALAQALAIISRAGCGALTLDPLHITRTGTLWEQIEALAPHLIGYVQICDGPLEASEDDYMAEAGRDRMLPGEGSFPLNRLLAIAPPAMPVSLEMPRQRLVKAGSNPFDVARDLVVRSRAWLEANAGTEN
ncbi:TIM barrel protein [Novosphingobium sp. PASSN1]|uniref:sugar phosphate isomerase/epimerase family protein n=1 Tax=Novosphingobium sp. PASSN1 TaxID=2015561 RepID=UPI0025D32C49|nr:TIM barrel protein [Novosphingobium sp. PASSN1]